MTKRELLELIKDDNDDVVIKLSVFNKATGLKMIGKLDHVSTHSVEGQCVNCDHFNRTVFVILESEIEH